MMSLASLNVDNILYENLLGCLNSMKQQVDKYCHEGHALKESLNTINVSLSRMKPETKESSTSMENLKTVDNDLNEESTGELVMDVDEPENEKEAETTVEGENGDEADAKTPEVVSKEDENGDEANTKAPEVLPKEDDGKEPEMEGGTPVIDEECQEEVVTTEDCNDKEADKGEEISDITLDCEEEVVGDDNVAGTEKTENETADGKKVIVEPVHDHNKEIVTSPDMEEDEREKTSDPSSTDDGDL